MDQWLQIGFEFLKEKPSEGPLIVLDNRCRNLLSGRSFVCVNRNFQLLSFGEEAEEDEREVSEVAQVE